MPAKYLIKQIEELCKKYNLNISETYNKLSEMYQDTYGVNIELERKEYIKKQGFIGTPEYLEKLGIVYRYVNLVNIYELDLKK